MSQLSEHKIMKMQHFLNKKILDYKTAKYKMKYKSKRFQLQPKNSMPNVNSKSMLKAHYLLAQFNDSMIVEYHNILVSVS